MENRLEGGRAGLAMLTAGILILAMFALYARSPAGAQEASNPDTECADASGYNGEWWKIQINEDGTKGTIETSSAVENNDIAFSIDNSEEPWKYSWTNQSSDGFAVVRVLEKEGHGEDVHDGLWLVGEGFSNEPVDGDISHITFCFAAAPPEPGEIIIQKEVTEGSDTTVAFTFTPSGFTLDDDTLAHGESASSGDVAAGGDYSVTESVPEGWTLQSAACTSTEEGDDSTPEDINVSEGETVTCTFVNHEEETTTTTEATTTTTTEATTTTTEATTTTTQATTATTVEDEVLGTVVTTTTEAPTTTVEDEVLGTEVLPFTGIESDHMAMLAMALLGGGLLTLVGSQGIRHRHEE